MRSISKWLLVAGSLLIVGSLVWLLVDYLAAENAEEETATLMEQLDELLPPPTEGITSADTEMPVLAVAGRDVVAVVELPAYDVRLPVGNTWDASGVTAYPRRFYGSAYDRSLVIGGSDRAGQLECLTQVELGDTVTVTDMTGAVFTYRVERVDRSDSAETEKLMDPDTHLTLFARDTYSLEYVLVRCVAK